MFLNSTSYEQKYRKYKNKYKILKNQLGNVIHYTIQKKILLLEIIY